MLCFFSLCPNALLVFFGPKYFPLIGFKTRWLNLQTSAIPRYCRCFNSFSLSCPRFRQNKISDFTTAVAKIQHLALTSGKKIASDSCCLFVYIWCSEWQALFPAKTTSSASGSAGILPNSTYGVVFIKYDVHWFLKTAVPSPKRP